jgi:hypothetical protein
MRRSDRLIALLTVCFCLPIAAEPRSNKLIEFGWDEPDTAFIRKHISEMQKTPFDGCVFHARYARPADGGRAARGDFMWECWSKRAFTDAELGPALEDLKATEFGRFSENFLRFNTTPADVDWFDDFSAIVNNAKLAAKVAHDGGCRGVLFDIEQYNKPLFNYPKQRDAATKSWDQYARQVHQRGREVMAAFQEGYPGGVTVFLTFGYSLPLAECGGDKAKLAEVSYGLLAPLLDGMVDAAEGRSRIVDGHELSYGYKDVARFATAYTAMKTGVLKIMGADHEKYAKHFSLGFGVWLDHDWRKLGWNTEDPAKNFYTPPAFEQTVRTALQTADDYVWIYTETPRWWSAEGGPQKLPDVYDAALRRAAAAALAPAR